MEKLAKEAKEYPGAGNAVLHPRLREMLNRINRDVEAGKALKTIRKRGCDEAEVLTVLFRFCGASEEEIRGGLDIAGVFKEDLERLSVQLKQDAQAVRKIMVELPRFGYEFAVPDCDELAVTIEDVTDTLSRIGRAVARSLRNVRLGDKGKGKGRVNLTAGRTHHLVELVDLVSADKEPTLADFKLIAPLVGVVLEDKRQDKYIADDLRKRFDSCTKPKPKR